MKYPREQNWFYALFAPPAPRFNFFDFLLEVPPQRQSYKSRSETELSIAKQPARSSGFLILELLTSLETLQERIRQRQAEQRMLMELVKSITYFEKNLEAKHTRDAFFSRPCHMIFDSGSVIAELPRSRPLQRTSSTEIIDDSYVAPAPEPRQPAPRVLAPLTSPVPTNHTTRMFAQPSPNLANPEKNPKGLATYKYARADDLENGWPIDPVTQEPIGIGEDGIDGDETIVCIPIRQTIPDPNNPGGPHIQKKNPDNTPAATTQILSLKSWQEMVARHLEAQRTGSIHGSKLIEPYTQLEIGQDIHKSDLFTCSIDDFRRHNPNIMLPTPELEETATNAL